MYTCTVPLVTCEVTLQENGPEYILQIHVNGKRREEKGRVAVRRSWKLVKHADVGALYACARMI